jgi:hypothetical protein
MLISPISRKRHRNRLLLLVYSPHESIPARERHRYEITRTLLQEVLAGKSDTKKWYDPISKALVDSTAIRKPAIVIPQPKNLNVLMMRKLTSLLGQRRVRRYKPAE